MAMIMWVCDTPSMTLMIENLRKSTEYAKLLRVINEYDNGLGIYYVRSPGNWGDALINSGSAQFFAENNIEVIAKTRDELRSLTVDRSAQVSGSLLLVGGGGGWCKAWFSTRDFVQEMSESFRHIIVLPTSYELPLLKNNNITYFSRGLGFDNPEDIEVHFCHDMAFYIRLTIETEKYKSWRLAAFRQDREQSHLSLRAKNSIDISLLGNSRNDIIPFFQIINRFNIVYTDRLHVGIAASMLNIRCMLFPSSYFKIPDVWRSSIKNNYKGTKLHSWDSRLDIFNL